jgi:hypothetical protein
MFMQDSSRIQAGFKQESKESARVRGEFGIAMLA